MAIQVKSGIWYKGTKDQFILSLADTIHAVWNAMAYYGHAVNSRVPPIRNEKPRLSTLSTS